MLTKEAFNALLKTLEEPPEYAYFILATTELNKIPTTIQSRCQVFPFRRIREEDIIRRLQFIADQEKITIDRDAIRGIAHYVEGGMRDAISLLDQMRSLPKITMKEVQERIGASGHEFVESVFTAIEQSDREGIVEAVRKVEDAGIPLDVFVRHMLGLVRTSLHEAIEAKQPTDTYLHMLSVLLDALRDIRVAPVPGLVLESTLLRLCNDQTQEKPVESKAVFSKMKKKAETEEKKEPDTVDTSVKKKVEREDVKPTAAIHAPEFTVETLRKNWPSIVDQTQPASVKMSLKNGLISTVDGNKVIVSFSSAFHRDKVAETEHSRTVEDIMEKIFKRQLKLECVTEGESGAPSVQDDVVNLAEAAAEIF